MSHLTMTEDAYRRERNDLLSRPCRCVACEDCRGLGFISLPTGGYPEDEIEGCEDCRGSGVSEQCARCGALDELEEAFDQ